jgi:hypothetical protein
MLGLLVLSYYPIDSRQMAIIIIDINDNNNMEIKLTVMTNDSIALAEV